MIQERVSVDLQQLMRYLRTLLEIPSIFLELQIERFEDRSFDGDIDRHVILDRIQTSEYKIEDSNLYTVQA